MSRQTAVVPSQRRGRADRTPDRRQRVRLYGLTVDSPLPLPGAPSAPGSRANVRIRPGAARDFSGARFDRPDWFHYRTTRTGAAHLRWSGLFEFLVSPDGCDIRYRRLGRASDESFATYLLSQVLSFSLLARGRDPLHGTAVRVGGEAVAFLAECGSGKSTLGAAMLARGFPVVTDDLLAVEPRGSSYVAHPGPARIKLFPGAARTLLPGRKGPVMAQGTRKMILSLGRPETVHQPVPLRALYVLAPRSRSQDVRIEPLPRSEALVEIVRASFNLLVSSPARLRSQFRSASRLAAVVPVKRLVYSRSLGGLPEVCDAIAADGV